MNPVTRARLVVAGLLVAGLAQAATFNLFQPAAGILKGNPSTYVTTAAAASDVISLWSGTCNASSFLRGDGSCAAAGGGAAGADTQVQFNNAGAFAGDAGLTYNSGSDTLTVGTLLLAPNLSVSSGNQTVGPVTSSSLILQTNTVARVEVTDSFTNFTQDIVDFTGAAGNWRLFQDASNFSVEQCDSLNSTCAAKLSFSAINNNVSMGSGGDTTISAGDDLILSFNGELTLNTDPGTTGQVLTSNGAGVPPTWEPAGGSGTVTSVGLTMPSGFSVGGSPVTSSGTLAVTTTLNGNLRGNGSGITTGAVALGSEVSGTLPVANGGTGTTTSTGTGNVVLSASPTLSGTITGGTFAGTHTGDGSGLTSLDAGDISAGTLAVARGGTGVTTSTGTGSVVLSASPTLTGTTTVATLAATAATVGGSNVCRADGTDCPAAGETGGTESLTLTAGCTTTPAVSVPYRKIGSFVMLKLPLTSCTTDGAASMTVGTLSVGLRPTNTQAINGRSTCNGSNVQMTLQVSSAGVISLTDFQSSCPAGTRNFTPQNLTYSTAL